MAVDTSFDMGTKTHTIKVSGRFDFGINKEFRKAGDVAKGVKTVIVDLLSVDYLDSSALGMLLVLREKMAGKQEAVRIRNVKPDVMKVLKIANFDRLFTLE